MPSPIEHIELSTGPNPKGSVIWMHGLGADCWDFVPIIKELDLPSTLTLRFVFPQAPIRPITVFNGQSAPGWYDISMQELQRKPDEAGVRESQGAINALIDYEISRGIAADNIVLAGFSQGGAIALQTGLRSAHKLGGIMALSTYLTLEDSFAAEKTAVNAGIPIFMVHGTQDNVIPISLARSSRAILETNGYKPEWHEYAMPHSVSPDEVRDISRWLTARFTSPIILG